MNWRRGAAVLGEEEEDRFSRRRREERACIDGYDRVSVTSRGPRENEEGRITDPS